MMEKLYSATFDFSENGELVNVYPLVSTHGDERTLNRILKRHFEKNRFKKFIAEWAATIITAFPCWNWSSRFLDKINVWAGFVDL